MCPAWSRGARGRWPRWVSAGRGLNQILGFEALLFSRLTRPVGATDYSIILPCKRSVGAPERSGARDEPVRLSFCHYGPGDAGHFVGKCHSDLQPGATSQKPLDPWIGP